jgi:hypothetical protein
MMNLEVSITRPDALRPGLATMVIDMYYGHDIAPVAFWAIVMAGFAYLVTRKRAIALWAGGLVLLHEAVDLLSGFPHFVLGPGTSSDAGRAG